MPKSRCIAVKSPTATADAAVMGTTHEPLEPASTPSPGPRRIDPAAAVFDRPAAAFRLREPAERATLRFPEVVPEAETRKAA
jgi:hypothetical protein